MRLKDGRVLIIGNAGAQVLEDATQVFDPSTFGFTPVGPMITPRSGAAVALLPDGHVLIAGGMPWGQDAATNSAELFDPNTSTFSLTGSLGTTRAYAAAASLPDGRVFVSPGESRKTAEVYDPTTGTFSGAGTTLDYGSSNVAIANPDGRVVVFKTTGLGEGDRRSLGPDIAHVLAARPSGGSTRQRDPLGRRADPAYRRVRWEFAYLRSGHRRDPLDRCDRGLGTQGDAARRRASADRGRPARRTHPARRWWDPGARRLDGRDLPVRKHPSSAAKSRRPGGRPVDPITSRSAGPRPRSGMKPPTYARQRPTP